MIFLFRIFTVPVVQGVTNDTQFRAFLRKYFVAGANSSTVDNIMAAYPADPDFVCRTVHSFSPFLLNLFFHIGFSLQHPRYPVPGLVSVHSAASPQLIITFPLVLSTSVSLPSKETSSLAPQRGQCWRLSPRFKVPSSGVRVWCPVGCLPLTLAVVWKRDKNVKYLGSVHGGELAEFYGISGNITDKVALDSVREFCSQNLRECCDEAECYPA